MMDASPGLSPRFLRLRRVGMNSASFYTLKRYRKYEDEGKNYPEIQLCRGPDVPALSISDNNRESLSVVQQDPRKDFPLGDSSSLLVALPCLLPGDGDLSRGLACHVAHFCPGRFLEQCSVGVEVTVVHLAGRPRLDGEAKDDTYHQSDIPCSSKMMAFQFPTAHEEGPSLDNRSFWATCHARDETSSKIEIFGALIPTPTFPVPFGVDSFGTSSSLSIWD
ncbi:uncharacterized protein LOC105240843 [Ailuropoda melanoleuca]|uniref:uncharacterized protein LOC105240843 n=1 Tax=Ailuropoda melanoleuca TaxID=9646 RepID=UPI00149406AF|nr:uncharacterized protein LOC105240843 [Ailuropoda melanoleuca]